MSDCRFGVSPVNYPDPDPESMVITLLKSPGKIMCISHNMDHIYQCINIIHSLFLKILRKTEILTSIKGHNSVEKLGKISCVSHNMAYTKFLSKSISLF